MASLTVVRDSGYADRMRAYKVILDGVIIGEIRNGQTKEFLVAPGDHQLSLKIDWCGSKAVAFTAAEGETPLFYAKSNLRGIRVMAALWFVLFDRMSYLLLEPGTRASLTHAGRLGG